MNKSFKLELQVTAILVLIFALGTFGYYLIEDGWTLFESFYMTAITITTVGYGEVKPLSDMGRWFSVFLVFAGLGAAGLFAGQLAKTFLENNFKDIFGVNKMKKEIKFLRDHFIVCGFGDIGFSICSVLSEARIPFVIIESDEKTAEYAVQRQFLTVNGKATYDTTLIQAGIKKAKGIVICLGEDSLNMHVSLAAREINPEIFIIARGYKSHIEKRMVRAGANTVVNPLKLGGEQIAELIVNQYKKDRTIDDCLIHKSSVMGYALKMYQHFQAESKSILEIKEGLGALQALKLRRSDGTEIDIPAEDLEVASHETVLFVMSEGETSERIVKNKKFDPQLFEWSDDYRVNVKIFDNEHKKLFELCHEFIESLNKGKGKETLAKTFDQLIDYTCTHFSSEEALFEEYGYPDAEAHIKEHKELTGKVLDLNKNKTYIFPDNVADFLYEWLKEHILDCDMKYAEFFQQKGVR